MSSKAALLQSDLTALELAALLKQTAGKAETIQMYNEEEGSLFLERCQQLGFGMWFNLYEMVLRLELCQEELFCANVFSQEEQDVLFSRLSTLRLAHTRRFPCQV